MSTARSDAQSRRALEENLLPRMRTAARSCGESVKEKDGRWSIPCPRCGGRKKMARLEVFIDDAGEICLECDSGSRACTREAVAQALGFVSYEAIYAEGPPADFAGGPSANGKGGSLELKVERAAGKAATTPTAPTKPRWPKPVPITELVSTTGGTDWLWHGCVARGHITLFSALMKAGKSTLLSYMLRALQHGVPFLGRDTKKTRTLLVSEESREKWIERREELGLDDALHVLCRPTSAKMSHHDWREFVEYLRDYAAEKFDLVMLDTIGTYAPWRDENDAAEVQATMLPLNMLTEAGLAVMPIHHFGKADGSEGRAARGSTALAGAVDVLLELRRFRPDEIGDRRRVLKGLGRFDEIPEELVIALAADNTDYTAEGDRKEIAAKELAAVLLEALPEREPGLTADEVHAALPDDGRPRRGDVMRALKCGAGARNWTMTGIGKRGDPHRFYRPVE